MAPATLKPPTATATANFSMGQATANQAGSPAQLPDAASRFETKMAPGSATRLSAGVIPPTAATQTAIVGAAAKTTQKPMIAAGVGNDPFVALDRIADQMAQLDKAGDRLLADVTSGAIKPESPAFSLRQSSLMKGYMSLQIQAQKVSMGAELLSKVVEHGTSSTKQILQTQA